jgi:transposase
MGRMPKGTTGRRQRRSFSAEYKAGAVRLVLDEGKTVAQVARDLDLTASAVAGWVKQARADRSKGKTGLTTEERAELVRLRKQVRVLEMERAILKKAAATSSGQGNVRSKTAAGERKPSVLRGRWFSRRAIPFKAA